jgi:cytochrome c553
MVKRWIGLFAVLGCTMLALVMAHSKIRAQDRGTQSEHVQPATVTLEGPAIHILVTARMPRGELRNLVTDPRTARDHPNLAAYYRSEAHRLEVEAQRYEQFARTFGDTTPPNAPNHCNISRTARHCYIFARGCLRQAQVDSVLAALNRQASEHEGCFACHSFHGRGGNIAPDLATEGSRGRSEAWLVAHFKDPQTFSAKSLMPTLGGLTDQQLEVLAAFLEYQKGK